MARLGDLYQITSGGTPSRKHLEYYQDGSIPWVKTGDLKEKYLRDTDEKITESGLNNSSARIYPKDTVLVAMYGATIGASSILKIEAATNQACAAFVKRDDVIPEFLYAFLESQKSRFIKDAVGGAQPNISAGYLKEIDMPLIPLEEQRRIAALLDKVSDLIAKRRAQLDKLDLLVKARFVEMFGDPETNPKQWPVLPMAKVCSVGSSKRIYQSEQCAKGVPFWRVSNLIELINTGTAMTDLYIPQERYNELKKQGQVPKAGDILLTSRGTLGQCYIVKKDDVFYFQDGMISWLYQYSENITPLYISYLFTMPGFRKQIESMQAGTTVSYLSIMMIKHLKVMLPSVSLQNEFTDFVKRADEFKLTLSMSLDKLIMLKNKLMEQYF